MVTADLSVIDEKDTVYAGCRDDCSVRALEMEQGNEKLVFKTEDQVASPPTVVGGNIYCNHDGKVYAIEEVKEKGD